MKKALWKLSLSVLSLLFLCALFTSCATQPKTEYITVTETKVETVTETEYVPVYFDLNDTIKTVVDQKPDNSKYVILTGTNLNVWGLMANSFTYQTAWEDWQAYAQLLEDTLYICRDKCADPNKNQDAEKPNIGIEVKAEEITEPKEPVESTETTENSSPSSFTSSSGVSFELPLIR